MVQPVPTAMKQHINFMLDSSQEEKGWLVARLGVLEIGMIFFSYLCLEPMAQERELPPELVVVVGSASFSNKYFTVSTFPPPHAQCKGVAYNIQNRK